MSVERPPWSSEPVGLNHLSVKKVSELIGLEEDDQQGWHSSDPAVQEQNWAVEHANRGKAFEDMIEDFGEDTPKLLDRQVDNPLVELTNWWTNKGCQDAELVVEKYQEYGNTALLEVGRQLADVMGRATATDAEAQELGIWFFMVGKMARWKTAILKGEQASKDTFDDLAIYATMARRVYEKGGWPGGE
jgi:hypothetical protein